MVEQGVDEDEAVAGLRAVCGPQALQDAAQLTAHRAGRGYPASREHRLLRAAAGDPLPAPTAEEMAVEARQRQLWEEPFDWSFRLLAEQVPGLRDLELRARTDADSFLRELSFRESGMIGRTPPRNPRDRQMRSVWGMDKAVKRLLGPDSGLPDPVLASPAAERAAAFYLRQAAGIDLRQWRKPRSAQ
ncbi:hypothetical protein [Geodermatophilus sp. SYSU D00815]